MAHPAVTVGETYDFANPKGKRSLLRGRVTEVIGTRAVRIVAADGKFHTVDASTARKPRNRKPRPTRRAIARELAE